MRTRIVVWAIVFALFTACHDQQDPAKENTNPVIKVDLRSRIFSKYLFDTFQLSLGEEKHAYVLIPGRGCKGCMVNTLERIRFLKPKTELTTVIVSSNNKLPDTLFPVPFLYDQKAQMELINMRIANITVVRTEKQKIIDIRNFDGILDQGLDSLLLWL